MSRIQGSLKAGSGKVDCSSGKGCRLNMEQISTFFFFLPKLKCSDSGKICSDF